MRKHIGIFACLLCVCLLLSGCTGSKEPAAEAAPETTSPAIPEELANQSSEAANADLTCTVTLGNRPTDTEPDAL